MLTSAAPASRSFAVAFVATLLAAAAAASAAPISWQLGPTFNGPNGFQAIQTNGTLVEAGNLGSEAPLMVSGINFVPVDKLNQGFFGSGSPGTSNANWNTIIDSTDWHGTNVVLPNFFTGLIPGNTYQAQLFASDSRTCCGFRTQFFSDGLGNNSPTITQNTFTSVIGTFTADAATQALGLTAFQNNPILNAYVLRDVTMPEPASAALLALASVALLRRRRAA